MPLPFLNFKGKDDSGTIIIGIIDINAKSMQKIIHHISNTLFNQIKQK